MFQGRRYDDSGATVIDTFELHYLSGGVFVNWAPDSTAFYMM